LALTGFHKDVLVQMHTGMEVSIYQSTFKKDKHNRTTDRTVYVRIMCIKITAFET